MMKAFGFLFLLLLIGTTAFLYLSCSTKGSTASNSGSRNAMILTVKSRKLKDNIDSPSPDEDEDDDIGQVNLEDYRPFDPVPSSTASIRPGPIEHGTPLMPFIPKPSPPPSQSKHVDVGFP
ncbi:hypothetical protein ACJIZ3_025067 [Penstemon smallii]|uniref:Uncharacterized protein n=1 Tax=Penstemon smallii TaxID=265156 RepID=A0ABD3TUY4_9LAMI